jgi:pimeloyl-ACP methyl ester carboxylesterase
MKAQKQTKTWKNNLTTLILRRFLYMFLLFSLLLGACSPQTIQGKADGAASGTALPMEDCTLLTPSGTQVKARCGTFTVPEDRANPAGRQIALNLAVIPAIARSPQPDALFLLAGGPGQSAVEAFPSLLPLLFNIYEERDIVLVDQRGTGKSNPLRCLDPDTDASLTDQEVLDLLKTCPERLDADLRFYTTEIAMTDLDAVRAALGYESINLYGASYGTRAALTYLRMFPERVRTVTLDSVVDHNFVMFMEAASDGQAALDKFFARCLGDDACKTSFPTLKSEFDGLLARLEENPAEISIPNPLTNQPLDLTVTAELVTSMVFNTLYAPDLVALLPLAIHSAYVDENYIPLISQAFMLNSGIYDGMFYSVTCAEDAPLIAASEAARRSENSVFGDRTVDFADICSAWPRGQVSAEFRDPVQSDVPVLILSGEADPITPPRHAESVSENLSNDTHLIFASMGHGNLTNRCSVSIFRDFIKSGSLVALDTTCVTGIQPSPFFVDFSGPLP